MGVRVQRVQKVQKVQRVVVGGCAANLYKTIQSPLWALEKPPLVAGATTFLHRKASHLVLRSLLLPYEPSSLATPQAGAQQPVLNLE